MADRRHDRETLMLRLFWMLLFVLAWGVAEALLLLLILAQLLLRLINGEPSRVLAQGGDCLSRYLAHIGRFACFHTESKPWPFADWPAARELEREQACPPPAPAPAARTERPA